jgi:hypothetical protein
MTLKGYANNAICPKCDMYTEQRVVERGVRQCLGCLTVFKLKDTKVKWAWPRKGENPSPPAGPGIGKP